ncbi:hypothetical protein [Cellulomonas composti]|uniref:DUF2510 domain-containing protein n=1 Tax=Cellulomonas composti TaxID=266130 RepID=A0A511J7P2_9CELL|nr:hypothetical protein [Cellulomonas composti]GEL93994.1 hypothetical protein CCO02nite_06520 [Cellulomonas composti]
MTQADETLTPAGWYPRPAEPGFVQFWTGVEWADVRLPERLPDGRPVRTGPLPFGAGDAISFVVDQVAGDTAARDRTPQTRATTALMRLTDLDDVLAAAEAYATGAEVAERLPLVAGGVMVTDALVGFDVKSPFGMRLGLIGAVWLGLWGIGLLVAGVVWNVVPWGHAALPALLDIAVRALLPLVGVALVGAAVVVAVARISGLGKGSVLLARGGRDAVRYAAGWRPSDLRRGLAETIYATRSFRKRRL